MTSKVDCFKRFVFSAGICLRKQNWYRSNAFEKDKMQAFKAGQRTTSKHQCKYLTYNSPNIPKRCEESQGRGRGAS